MALNIAKDVCKFYRLPQTATDEKGEQCRIVSEIPRIREIVLAPGHLEIVMTDQYLVVCCEDFGNHIVEMKKNPFVKNTDNNFRTMWDAVKIGPWKTVYNLGALIQQSSELINFDMIKELLRDMVVKSPRGNILRKHNCILLEDQGLTPKAVFAEMRLNTHMWDEEMDKLVDSKNK